MKTHAMQGWEMLRRAAQRMGHQASMFLPYGVEIARHHPERWDGAGYPMAWPARRSRCRRG